MTNLQSPEGVSNLRQNLEKVRPFLNPKYVKGLLSEAFQKLREQVKEIESRLKNLRQSNYDLALFHYTEGNFFDARLRFWIYSIIWKDAPEAEYFIGRCYLEEGKYEKATPYFERYLESMDKKFKTEAEYSLKVSKNESNDISQIPELIIRHNQTQVARYLHKKFESDDYVSNTQIEFVSFLTSSLTESDKPLGNKTLELGCGIGAIGAMLKDSKVSTSMTGVDMCEELIEKAKKKMVNNIVVYDHIFNLDINSFYEQHSQNKYDLIVAAELLSTYGEPENIFRMAKQLLSSKGYVAISFRTHEENQLKKLSTDFEQFSYSLPIMKEIANREGLKVTAEKEVKFLMDLPGSILVLCAA